MLKIKAIIFDWGNTLMKDFTVYKGPMFYWPKVELITGTEDILKFLRDKYVLCVATNAGDSDTFLMRKALERGGIEHYFKYFFSSNDTGCKKTDPEFFKYISSITGLDPESCIMIGNDYYKDLTGAAKAGCKAFLFNHEMNAGEFPLADEIFYDFNELREIMKKY